MNSEIFTHTNTFLGCLLDYVHKVYKEPDRFDANPEQVKEDLLQLARSAGTFEGRRLKGWGLISSEVEEILKVTTAVFGLHLEIKGSLKLPLTDKVSFILQKHEEQTEWLLQEELWLSFNAMLLSVYGMQNVTLVSADGTDPLKKIYRITVISEVDVLGGNAVDDLKNRDFVHKMNNHLGGVVSFASLLEQVDSKGEIAEMILLSAEKASQLLKKSFPKKD
ncbi:MAG: hypothetical protein HQK83_15775 [Fibrobacteria bacterium]|nr:hypothetical protein [Fibrobacteria bacterium]